MNMPERGNKFIFYFVLYYIFGSTLITVILEKLFNLQTNIILNQLVRLGVPVVFYFAVTEKNVIRTLKLHKLSFYNGLMIVAMTLLIQPMLSIISLISTFFSQNITSDLMINLEDKPFVFWLIALVLMPAVFEEVILRGIFASYYERVDVKKAALVNGIVFAIIHFDFQKILYASIMGTVLFLFVYVTKSIFASVISHFTFNLTQVIIFYSLLHQNKWNMHLISNEFLNELVICILFSIVCLPAFVFIMRRFFSYNKKNHQQKVEMPQNNIKSKILTKHLILLVVLYIFICLLQYLS